MNKRLFAPLSGNILKLIAAALMLIDHIGVILFPTLRILRIIGRISFPIFAFMVAEGCRHTKNKARYILTMLGFAVVIQTVYYLYSGGEDINILFTLTLSILVIFSMDNFKHQIFGEDVPRVKVLLAFLLLFLAVSVTFMICRAAPIEYGFSGCMLAVMAAIFHSEKNYPAWFVMLDNIPVSVLMLGLGLAVLCIGNSDIQVWSMLSMPLLLMYSGKRGKLKMKYFFYLFYPLHLVILYFISLLISA